MPENSNTKYCRKAQHPYTGSYCKTCKADRERERYQADPEAQRKRKRIAYRKDHPHAIPRVVTKRATKRRMSAHEIEEECAHEVARLQEREGRKLYYCFECDTWIDPVTGEAIADPDEGGEPHAGKAQAPTQNPQSGVGAQKQKSQPTTQQQPRGQKRNDSLLITVQCKHTDSETGKQCLNTFKVWPANLNLVEYCPQIHRLQHKRKLNAERQKRWRQNHL